MVLATSRSLAILENGLHRALFGSAVKRRHAHPAPVEHIAVDSDDVVVRGWLRSKGIARAHARFPEWFPGRSRSGSENAAYFVSVLRINGGDGGVPREGPERVGDGPSPPTAHFRLSESDLAFLRQLPVEE
eukprot:331620-Rhodomonas_salina.3